MKHYNIKKTLLHVARETEYLTLISLSLMRLLQYITCTIRNSWRILYLRSSTCAFFSAWTIFYMVHVNKIQLMFSSKNYHSFNDLWIKKFKQKNIKQNCNHLTDLSVFSSNVWAMCIACCHVTVIAVLLDLWWDMVIVRLYTDLIRVFM